MTHPFEATNLAERLQLLQDTHAWMEPQAQVVLASSDTPDSELAQIADSLRDQVRQTWDGITHFFDDPVLQKEPTKQAALQRYVNSTYGPSPIATESLAELQENLRKRGHNLAVTGVWDAASQAAYQAEAQKEYDAQSSGRKTGSVSAGSLLHSVIDAISPAGMADAVVGFVKSVPADVMQLLGDAHGALTGTMDFIGQAAGTTLSGEFDYGRRADSSLDLAKRTSTGVQRNLGAEPVNAEELNVVQNVLNDIGTIFLLSGGSAAAQGVKASVKKASGEGFTTRITTDEAIRQQGVVAKTLLQKRIATQAAGGAALGAVTGGVQAGVTGDDITQGVVGGAVLGAVGGATLPKKAFNNLPVMKNSGPMLGRLLDNDGLYYTARTRLATPYQYGAVRAAGTTMSQGMAFSLKAHGVGYLQEKFGDGGLIADSIANANVLDPVQDALHNKLAFTAAGVHFTPDLDYLMFFLHGPMQVGAKGSTSEALGGTVRSATDGFNAALQRTGAIAQVERGTGQSYKNLLRMAGGDPDRLHAWIGNKVKQHAAMQHADEVYFRLKTTQPDKAPAYGSDDYYDLVRAESAAVWHDPEAMRTAVARMLGGDQNYLARNIQHEMTKAAMSPRDHLRHELSDYLDAGDLLTHSVLPHADTYLLTPTPVRSLKKGVDPDLFGGNPPDELFDTMTQLRARSEVAPGTLGLTRVHFNADGTEDLSKSTLTSQQAKRDLERMRTELAETLEDPVAQAAWVEKAREYLFDNYGMDARALSVFDDTPDKLVNLLADRAEKLAAEVHLSADAPTELKRAFAQIRAKGYRVVAGTDIGHAFRSDLPPFTQLGEPISRARKIVSAIGMNPQQFGRLDYGADRRLHVTQALQKAVDEGRIKLPRFYSVQTLLNDLQDDEIVGKQLPWAANILFPAFRRAHKGAIEGMVEAGTAKNAAEAEAILKNNIAAAGGLRNLTIRDVRRVLTRTQHVPSATATKTEAGLLDDVQLPLMDEDSATEVWKALQKGFSQTPASVIGLQKVEDFARYLPFQARDAAAAKVPGVGKLTDNAATLALMALPTNLARWRDHLRFTISPFFSLSNVAEVNLKMGIDGVVPTFTPVKALRDKGVYEKAHELLDRVNGAENPRFKYLDDMDRFLDQQDVFGLYNPRHYEAYYAWERKQAGWSDEEIHEGLVRVFMYGANGREGRTALERSTNVIWFPFSFTKALMRNVGGYMLDKPAQALILSNALAEYRDFNNHHLNGDNPLAMSWYKEHLPLLNEALRLNSFARGISPGELGGINRPLLNLFLPQSWESDEKSAQTLRRFVPLANDYRRIKKEGGEQTRIVKQSLLNGIATIKNEPTSSLNRRPSAKTELAQRIDAKAYRTELLEAFKDVLAYNDSVADDESKYHFGGPNIPDTVDGLAINRTSIGLIVQHAYPVYDPDAGAAFAIKRDRQAQQWLQDRKGTPEYASYKDFYDKAKTALRHLNDDDYPPEQAAQLTSLFRQAATEFAAKDPEFYKWYKRTFERSGFGPLEAL